MFLISPNEVFGDIMVLALPPRPPVDPDDVNTLTGFGFYLVERYLSTLPWVKWVEIPFYQVEMVETSSSYQVCPIFSDFV